MATISPPNRKLANRFVKLAQHGGPRIWSLSVPPSAGARQKLVRVKRHAAEFQAVAANNNRDASPHAKDLQMTLDKAEKRLTAAGYKILTRGRTGNDDGFRVELEGGGIVNIFDTGKCSIQGHRDERLSALFKSDRPKGSPKDSDSEIIVTQLKTALAEALSRVEALERHLALQRTDQI